MHLVHSLFTGSDSAIHLDGSASVSAHEVATDGARLAGSLQSMGLDPGDRVAVWAENGLSYLRCLAAAAAGRFVLVSVNTRSSSDEARVLVERTGARVLVADREVDVDRLDTVLVPVRDIEALVSAGCAVRHDDARADDPFVVFATSGTTSRPKLVLHHQQSITRHAHDVARLFGYRRGDARVLAAMPLCGVFGLCSLTGALAGNAEIWLPGTFDAAGVAATVEREAITELNGSDDMFHRLLATGRDLSSIELAGYARFNASLDGIVARADAAGVPLAGLYGMSEVQALFALRDPSAPVADRERAGGTTASPDAAMRVVDPDSGEPVGIGIDGELQLAGPSLFAGYLADGGASIDVALTDANHVIDGAGRRWFRTGDLARIEDDGTFVYLSRIGDVLRLGGFLVSPLEVETVVLECAGVMDAQVIAVARPGGVRPVAVVVADGPVDEQVVISHCRARLATFKCPIAVFVVDEFPTTPSANGTKVQRAKLRELAETLLG